MAALRVVVLIWMLLRAMVLETSSACVHSPPSSQALTAALLVIVAIAMLLRTMLPKISSACAHSPPFSQALTAALHVIVSIWMLLRAMTPVRLTSDMLQCPTVTLSCSIK